MTTDKIFLAIATAAFAACTSTTLVSADGGPPCPTTQTLCGSLCATLSADSSNCGACGVVCGSGRTCVAGACAASCPSASSLCGQICVDFQSDDDNCGACGNACAAGQRCLAGACQTTCATGLLVCDATCVNPKNDLQNCGGCADDGGVACGPAQVCTQGSCAALCAADAGETLCADAGPLPYCASFADDPQNCGSCGERCPTGQSCAAGTCACPASAATYCGGLCTDTGNDPQNCGACGKVCGSGLCTLGSCHVCAGGRPTFPPAILLPSVTLSPDNLLSADLTGNGRADLIIEPDDALGLELYLQTDGGLASPQVYGGTQFGFPAIADLTGSGQLDIVEPGIDGLYLFYNQLDTPDGGFNLVGPALASSGQQMLAAAVADFNGDGLPDIAVSGIRPSSRPQQILGDVDVFLQGDGGFPLLSSASYDGGPGSAFGQIVAADLDGDGHPDLAVQNASGFVVFTNHGDGTFPVQTAYAIADQVTGIAVGDIDGDGRPDLVLSGQNTNSAFIYLNVADAGLTALPAIDAGTLTGPLSVLLTDVDGDGRLDIVLTLEEGAVAVLYNEGGGNFAPAVTVTANATDGVYAMFPSTAAVADFNGDGVPDIAVGNTNGAHFLNITYGACP